MIVDIRFIKETKTVVTKHMIINDADKHMRVSTQVTSTHQVKEKTVEWYGTMRLSYEPVADNEWNKLTISKSNKLEKIFDELLANAKTDN
jgi:translation initiation factor 2 alpha subunit (eIF-2alpha)